MTTIANPASLDYVEITSGPAKGELIDGLKYAFGEHKFTVRFYGRRIVDGEVTHSVVVLEAQIISLSYDDGGGQMFAVRANIVNQNNDPAFRGTLEFPYTIRGNTGTLHLTK